MHVIMSNIKYGQKHMPKRVSSPLLVFHVVEKKNYMNRFKHTTFANMHNPKKKSLLWKKPSEPFSGVEISKKKCDI